MCCCATADFLCSFCVYEYVFDDDLLIDDLVMMDDDLVVVMNGCNGMCLFQGSTFTKLEIWIVSARHIPRKYRLHSGFG